MKVKDVFYINPSSQNHKDFINYIDTSSVLSGRLVNVQYLDSDFPSRAQREIQYGDILYSSVRPNLRHYYLYTSDYQHPVGSSGFVLLRCKDIEFDRRFAYYYLTSNPIVNYLSNIAELSQATFPSFSAKDLGKVNLPDFCLQKQQKISSILSSYDLLIENNNKRIKLLEQMAENLYKEWFVRFRFPGHEKTEMVNGLPKGWKRDKVNKFYKTSSGGTPSRTRNEYYENGNIPWVKTGEIEDSIILETEEYITDKGVEKSSAKILPSGTLLMAMYGVNIGMLGILSKPMACNQAACVFFEKEKVSSKHYLFYMFKSLRDFLLSISFGAAQQNLSQKLIQNIRIVMPSDDTLFMFDKYISPLFEQIKTLQQQNNLLTRQRDLLLPRLMSGKLEVKP